MYEMIDQHKTFESSLLENCPALLQFWQRVRDLPAIKAYINSNKFSEHPINNLTANWT